MTPMLRWLIWAGVLIVGWSVVLDWEDQVTALLPERLRIAQLQAKELEAIQGVPWASQAAKAHSAQVAWLERLKVVKQMGVFRAEAMEEMADLCVRLEAACQVAALGETLAIADTSSQKGRGGAMTIPGLVSTSVRITIALPGNKLVPLLQEIENGEVIRKVEKLTVRSGRADFVVKTFGIESSAADAVRNAHLQSEGKSAATADPKSGMGS